jgi:hypothetical protein
MALGVIPKACGTIAPDFGQSTVWQLPGTAPKTISNCNTELILG